MAFVLCGMNLFGDNRSHVFFGALALVGALFILHREMGNKGRDRTARL